MINKSAEVQRVYKQARKFANRVNQTVVVWYDDEEQRYRDCTLAGWEQMIDTNQVTDMDMRGIVEPN